VTKFINFKGISWGRCSTLARAGKQLEAAELCLVDFATWEQSPIRGSERHRRHDDHPQGKDLVEAVPGSGESQSTDSSTS
jgi:hypothetical protein